MTKFKIGDKVRVRKDLIPGEKYMCISVAYGMKRMCGKIATIKRVSPGYDYIVLEESDYIWSPGMLEPVKEDKLIFNGNATILFKDGKKYVTKCDTSDTYDREKGLLTVLAKANGYNSMIFYSTNKPVAKATGSTTSMFAPTNAVQIGQIPMSDDALKSFDVSNLIGKTVYLGIAICGLGTGRSTDFTYMDLV